jgi:hypothetical protein
MSSSRLRETTSQNPASAAPLDQPHPLPPECSELATASSIGDQSHHFSESEVPRTDDEPQISKKTDSDRSDALGEGSRLGTEELLQAGIWAAGLRMRKDSDHPLKKAPSGQVIVRVEVEPFEMPMPDWEFGLSWEQNYSRIAGTVREHLLQAKFTLTECLRD